MGETIAATPIPNAPDNLQAYPTCILTASMPIELKASLSSLFDDIASVQLLNSQQMSSIPGIPEAEWQKKADDILTCAEAFGAQSAENVAGALENIGEAFAPHVRSWTQMVRMTWDIDQQGFPDIARQVRAYFQSVCAQRRDKTYGKEEMQRMNTNAFNGIFGLLERSAVHPKLQYMITGLFSNRDLIPSLPEKE